MIPKELYPKKCHKLYQKRFYTTPNTMYEQKKNKTKYQRSNINYQSLPAYVALSCLASAIRAAASCKSTNFDCDFGATHFHMKYDLSYTMHTSTLGTSLFLARSTTSLNVNAGRELD